MTRLEQYSQANTCPHCGRHPRPNERLPEWITHIATCPARELVTDRQDNRL